MTREVFKEIPLEGYEDFRVSNYGKVLNIKTGNILKGVSDKNGYQVISLGLSTKETKQVKIHRLVGYAFIPNPLNKPCINHKDGVKSNNFVDNIEWVTHKENTQHALNNNLFPVGEKSTSAKLTNHAVSLIRESLRNNCSIKDIAEDFGIGRTAVFNIKHNLRWKYVSS